MKNFFIASAIAVALLFSFGSANAQKTSKKISIGIGLEGGVPTGDLSKAYSFGGGLTLRGSYNLGPGFVTLTTGGLAWAPKSISGQSMNAGVQVPVKAGYKFIFQEYLFAMAEVGYNSFRSVGVDINGNVATATHGGYVFAPAVGVQFNALELGLRYELFSMPGTTGSFLGIRLGFNF